ncbi:MAG: hypothetical protein GWN87_30025 [Desulfuromonadales bacterium]|nr:hypothetical protein [Desulfuromonadales bacterium]NIS43833.1 hypothetical protein [Desulfuromonadales bacterium]
MEDLWKFSDLKHRLNDSADRAEYDRLVKSFREEEQSSRQKDLLFDQIPFKTPLTNK